MRHKQTEQTKKKLSEIRKKWLADNPEKHPWKRKDKFLSKPCEFFKKKLSENNLTFSEEQNLLEGRAYSVDVVFYDKMIGFEINGNQHYNSDKTLKDYYKKRKEEIEILGWKLYDIHYTKVYNEKFIEEIIKFIKEQKEIPNFNFEFFIKKVKKICKDCGKEISYNSIERCLKCHNISRRTEKYEVNLKYKIGVNKKEKFIKNCNCGEIISINSNNCKECFDKIQRKIVDRPSLEILLEEVKDIGYSAVGRKYGVSDNSIRKWIKNYQK
jgi:very-short-patch-repair endonuclease